MQSRPEIVLIGPFGSGKSTVGDLLAQHLGVPSVSMDSEQHYYAEAGFDKDEFRRLLKESGLRNAERYFFTFFPVAIERLLAEHHDCVFDLGAGHTVYEDEALFDRVKTLLVPFRNVVLVLPSPDLDESVRILRAREVERNVAPHFLNSKEFDYFSHWVKSPCNFELAKFVVYTEGKTPEETRDEVLRAVGF